MLNQNFFADKLNQKWIAHVTEFSLFDEKLYLSPIINLYSSELVSYTISDRPMLDKAFKKIQMVRTLFSILTKSSSTSTDSISGCCGRRVSDKA